MPALVERWRLEEPRRKVATWPALWTAGDRVIVPLQGKERREVHDVLVVDGRTGARLGDVHLPGDVCGVVALGERLFVHCRQLGAPTGRTIAVGTPGAWRVDDERELTELLVALGPQLDIEYQAAIPLLSSLATTARHLAVYVAGEQLGALVLDPATAEVRRAVPECLFTETRAWGDRLVAWGHGPVEHPRVGLFAWDLDRGEQLVRHPASASLVEVVGDVAFYQTYDPDGAPSSLGAFDLAARELRWSSPAGPGVQLVADAAELLAYAVVAGEPRLARWDAATGRIGWTSPVAGASFFARLERHVVQFDASAILDRETGALVEQVELGSFVAPGPSGSVITEDAAAVRAWVSA